MGGLTPPVTLSSRSRKKNSVPFSELSAVDLCSSVVLALALEGLAVFAAKDTAGSSIAGVVPTPAPQSPTLANQQPQLPQRLPPAQQLTRLLVVQQPQTVPPQLEVKQLLVATPQPAVLQPLVMLQPRVLLLQQLLNAYCIISWL